MITFPKEQVWALGPNTALKFAIIVNNPRICKLKESVSSV
jgi:hypothetical protein